MLINKKITSTDLKKFNNEVKDQYYIAGVFYHYYKNFVKSKVLIKFLNNVNREVLLTEKFHKIKSDKTILVKINDLMQKLKQENIVSLISINAEEYTTELIFCDVPESLKEQQNFFIKYLKKETSINDYRKLIQNPLSKFSFTQDEFKEVYCIRGNTHIIEVFFLITLLLTRKRSKWIDHTVSFKGGITIDGDSKIYEHHFADIYLKKEGELNLNDIYEDILKIADYYKNVVLVNFSITLIKKWKK